MFKWAVQIENRGVSISPLPLSLCASVSSSFSGCSFRPLSLKGASCGATEGLLSLFFCCLGVYLRWNWWWWCLWWWCFITPALADRARRDGCVWVWVERGHRCEGGRGVEGRTTGGKGDGVGGLPLEWRREPSHAPLAPLELPPQSPPLVRVHAKKSPPTYEVVAGGCWAGCVRLSKMAVWGGKGWERK